MVSTAPRPALEGTFAISKTCPASSALLVAAKVEPGIIKACVFSHRSQERGHAVQLEYLDVEPLLELDLRLGEGTGTALAYSLVKASVAFLNEMASFESAGVSGKV